MSVTSGFERQVQLQKNKFFRLYYEASNQSIDLCISIRKIILLFILEEYREKFQNVKGITQSFLNFKIILSRL